MFSFIKNIYSRPFLNETRSITEIMLYRFINTAIWIYYKIRYAQELTKSRKFISAARDRNIAGNRKAFVFANGPSVGDIDPFKIKKFCESGEFDLIAINSYLSKSADIAPPTYAVFADNIHFINPTGQYRLDIEKCEALGITYFAPAKYAKKTVSLIQAYCSLCNIDTSNTSNILKPAGYYGVTAFFALSLAKMLGYQKIYICGFDNSYFLDFEVLDDGAMCIRHKHYYDDQVSETKVKCLYGSTSEFFMDIHRHFSFLEKIISSDPRFFNIAKTTFLNKATRSFVLDVYLDK